MKREYSYGVIPLRFFKKDWQVLLVHHYSGHWAFPKGHPDKGETPQQTAERELNEETGLIVQNFLSVDPFEESYYFTFLGQRIYKTVKYFLALVKGKIVLQEKEIQGSRWLTLPEAASQITFKEGKRICLQVFEFLKTIDKQTHPLISKEKFNRLE